MNTFTAVFIVLLGLTLLTQLWLTQRQIRHVTTRRNKVPEAFQGRITLKAHRRAADYTAARSRFTNVENVYGALLLVFWTIGGGADLLDRTWRAVGWGGLATGTAFLLSALLIMGLLDLPANVYRTFVIENRFGFNRTTPALFFADQTKQVVLLVVLGTPLILAALSLMQEAGALWWIYVWLLWVGFGLFLAWAYPTWIAPLFNRFTPLPPGTVRRRIQRLLRRTGFVSRGIYVVDSSRRTTHGNAYFTGFGRAKRIVFFDSLLKSLSTSEIEAVLAHELGHFKLRHVLKRLAVMFGASLLALAVLGWLVTQPWFYAGLGVSQPSAHAALLLFILAGPVFTFFLHPLVAMNSRRHEYEADRFAATVSSARALASALTKLYRDNASTLTPDPVHSAFYDSHPPATRRIAHLLGRA
jgi:STE24 endopeptidase